MKQQLFKASMLIATVLFITACSKEHIEPNKNEPTQGIVFTMSEAPYNDDIDIATRAHETKLIKDTIYWDGIEAEVTLERDTEQPKQETRAITSGNHYTIVVFNAGTSIEVTKIKGHFDAVTGFFKYDADSESREIPAGFYDFVCYTHQYATRSGTTVTIPQANAGKAFVCRQTNVEIKNVKQQTIAFTMKHVGARVRTKLMAIGDISGVNATLGYQANKVPASIDYDMLTGNMTTSTAKNSTATSAAQSYTIQGTKSDAVLNDNLTTVTGNDYLAVLAGTKSEELVYNITGGTVYNATLNTNGDRTLKAGSTFEANGAYTLTIRLIPRILYLFEDRQTSYLNETSRQGHVPIAIVFDKVGKRAISLWDANGGVPTTWYGLSDHQRQHNDIMYGNAADALQPAANQGLHWTWDASGSKDGTTIKANEQTKYPAFYYAGKFYESSDLTSKLTAKGKTLNNDFKKDRVWYLPSWYEWKEVFVKLGLGDGSQIVGENYKSFKASLVSYAFTVADGTPIVHKYITLWYNSSSEKNINQTFYIRTFQANMQFLSNRKNTGYYVRPFVAY